MPTHIQIGDITPRIQYTGDGTQTRFDFPFPIFETEDLEVYIDDTPQVAGYTVYEPGESDGGYIIFGTAPVTDAMVTLRRWLAISRTSDFQESGELRAEVLNDELDYQTAALQQLSDGLERSLRLSPTDSAASLALPDAAERAGNYLAFDGAGALIAATAPEGGNPVSSFMATVLDDITATAARATLDAQQANALLGDIAASTFVQGDILYFDGTNIKNLGPGTAGQFLKTQGAAADPVWAAAGGGKVLQMVSNIDGVTDTGTNPMPRDDTYPQNTEGDEYYTLSITPKSATSKLVITCPLYHRHTNTIRCMALFVDSDADAIAATAGRWDASWDETMTLHHVEPSGSTDARTYKLRAGSSSSGTFTVNDSTFGGVARSGIIITEIET